MHIPDEILTVARQSVLRFGSVSPMLFVEGTKGKVYIPLPFGETNAQRMDIMSDAGITVARSGKVGDVGRIMFVTEAWVSPAREKLTKLPSEDPDRMEVLLFNALDAKSNVQELEMYACIRNGRKGHYRAQTCTNAGERKLASRRTTVALVPDRFSVI